jgi:hypothetical protein
VLQLLAVHALERRLEIDPYAVHAVDALELRERSFLLHCACRELAHLCQGRVVGECGRGRDERERGQHSRGRSHSCASGVPRGLQPGGGGQYGGRSASSSSSSSVPSRSGASGVVTEAGSTPI